MKLSGTKFATWFLGTILGVLGLLIYFGIVTISGVTLKPFWLVTAGFAILSISPILPGR